MAGENSLKQKTVRGVFWSMVDNFSSQGLSFLFGILLARLLSPSEFGTIAVLTIFLAVSQTLVNSGFSQALIRKLDRNEEDYTTTFYFNIAVGVACYLVLFLASPFIADFFKIPELSTILKVIGLVVVLNSFSVIQQAHLLIKVDFKSEAKVSITSVLLSGSIGLLCAYKGLGVWSLVAQQLSFALFRMVLLWAIVRWRPRGGFSKGSFSYLFGFGSKLVAASLLDTIWNNAYEVVIGRFFSAATLGLYARAKTFANFPSGNLTAVFQRVTFPVLSQMQDDTECLRTNYRKVIRMAAFVIFPLMVLLAVLAKPFVLFLLTEKWAESILLLQLLCLSMMWFPINMINMNLLQVKGRTDLYLKLELVKKLIGVIALAISVPMGVVPMCIATIITSILFIVINTYYTGKFIQVGFLRQMRDLLPTLLNCAMMAGSVWWVVRYLEHNLVQLLVGTLTALVCYFLVARLFRMSELQELITILKRR